MLGKTTAPFTLDEYYQELTERLSAETTAIFVDTNILAYPYRLFREARRELLGWFDDIRAQHRLHVPAWAANEYFVRTSTAKLVEFFPKIDPRASLEHLDGQLQVARLALDDAALRGRAANRDDLIRDLDAAIEALRPHLEALNVDRRQVDAIHDEVEATFAECVLGSDIARLCAETSATAAHRVLHRLPPSFEDAGKKLNPWGDLILWNELLECVQASHPRPRHVMLLTNDEKRDWSYAPRIRRRRDRNGNIGIEANKDPEIRLTDPRLLQEFRARLGGQETAFEVVSIKHIIASLGRADPARFRLLSVALQLQVAQEVPLPERGEPPAGALNALGGAADREPQPDAVPDAAVLPRVVDVEPPAPGGPEAVEGAVGAEQPATPEGEATEVPLTVGDSAIADARYRTDAENSAIDKTIEALRSHNWYVQNPAIGRIADLARYSFSAEAWFVLGRNVYQTACGTAYEAIEYIKLLPRHLSALPVDAANALLGGMLFEVYFDSAGELRAKKFKTDYLDELVRAANVDRYKPALRFVVEYIEARQPAVVSLPNVSERIPVMVAAERVGNDEGQRGHWQIRELLLKGRSVLKPGSNDGGGMRAEELRKVLGQKYGLPPGLLDLVFEPAEASKSYVYLREDQGFKSAAEFLAEADSATDAK
ncbi:PIN-like domain-containing protein [Sorangium sp. So ce1389]|uniref:PIN-like domain-containing protein n=1 Tax=Sorangium sp. So ce1389 TaxID=3133336 RepID=UPI003F6348FE